MHLLAGLGIAVVVLAVVLTGAVVVFNSTCGGWQAAARVASANRIHVSGWDTGDDGWSGVDGEISRSGFFGGGDTVDAIPQVGSVDQLARWTAQQQWGYVGTEDLNQAYTAANRWVPEMLRVDSSCRPVAMTSVVDSHSGQSFTFGGYS